MRRAAAWIAAVVGVAAAAGVAALLLAAPPPSPPGPEPGRTLFQAHCASCHGSDGRGSWRARLLLLRPGDLTAPDVAGAPDRYLADIIRQGGASIGKPGMPSFGFSLSDAEIGALVAYLRTLPASASRSRAGAVRTPGHARPASAAPSGSPPSGPDSIMALPSPARRDC